jgi:hypothetical protein
MFSKQLRLLTIMFMIICLFACTSKSKESKGNIYFKDDFETGAGKWDLVNADKIEIVDTGDPEHGKALCLYTGGETVYALIKGSDGWTDIKIEGDVFFPWYTCSYLGLIYHYNVNGPRTDFGSVFILGPFGEDLVPYFRNYWKYVESPPDHFMGNIIWVNPHRASNASRNNYSEYWVTLTDETRAIKPGKWGHFKAEIVGPACHFYVMDMETPIVTYNFFEFSSGRVGFKPRFTGSEVWIDNIKVTPLKELSYKGPILPAGITYKPAELLTDWKVAGPFTRRIKEIETQGYQVDKSYTLHDQTYKWEPFESDPRGCIVTGKLTNRFNYNFFVYLYTEIDSPDQKEVTFEFSSTNPLVLWVNNKMVGNVKRQFVNWYDFRENPEHKGEQLKATLEAGKNRIMVLNMGGNYGGDGFYAYCNMNPPEEKEEDRKIGR